jgi:hypothetical protein
MLIVLQTVATFLKTTFTPGQSAAFSYTICTKNPKLFTAIMAQGFAVMAPINSVTHCTCGPECCPSLALATRCYGDSGPMGIEPDGSDSAAAAGAALKPFAMTSSPFLSSLGMPPSSVMSLLESAAGKGHLARFGFNLGILDLKWVEIMCHFAMFWVLEEPKTTFEAG